MPRVKGTKALVAARPFHYAGRQAAELWCDQTPLAQLARQYGTPLYVYSEANIRERVALFQRAFAGLRHTVCYAVKANSNLSLLRLMAGMGCGFDIVSGGELERVRLAAKKSLPRIVFSGVGKTAAEIDAALVADIRMFNVESEAELGVLEQRARRAGIRARFAIRVNPDVFAETHPYISTGMHKHKFGVPMRDAVLLYKRAARSRWLDAAGISVHIGSQIRAAEPFGQAVERVASLAAELRKSVGCDIRYIDAGGGLGIAYESSERFDPAAVLAEYAAQVESALKGFDGELLLEPGRFLVAQAGALVMQVVGTKRNGDKRFVITDAGMNDMIRPTLYQAWHEIVPVRRHKGRADTVDIVGPVCETGDFFARDRKLQPVQAGDLLALLDAGAYGMSISSNYNSRPRAAEVLVNGKKHRLIRRRETVADMVAAEKSFLTGK